MKKITSVFLLLGCLLPTQAQNVPPCTFEIVDAETFSTQWTVIDNNQAVSPNTWAYSEDGAWYEQDMSNDADDWIVSPAVTLDAGKTYNISAYVKHDGYFMDQQKIELKVGHEATVEGLTTQLFSDESFQSRLFVEKSGTFSPDESGTYYIGLHCYSDSHNGDLYLQKIVVEESPIYPAQISDLTVEAGKAGELSAHLSWTWPSTDQYGNPLTLLSGAKIYRDGDLITTIEEATIGQAAEWTDQTIEQAGSYDYEVVVYNSFGDAQGEATSVTSPWIGTDTPEVVTQLTATAENETVTLSFTPPTVGENGGYIDPGALTYQISRTPGGLLTAVLSGPLPYVEVVPALGRYTYTVTATFDGKSSDPVTSDRIVAGGMKELPYSESFDTESALDLFTIIDGNNDDRSWKYYESKQLMQFWGGDDADEWLITPQLRLQAGKSYKLVFKTGLENAAQSSNYKDLYVTIGSQATVESQSRQLFHETIESALMEEKEVIFSVTESGGYYIGFHCYGSTSYSPIFVDDLALDETIEIPAAVTDLTVTPGENGTLSATIQWTNPSLSAAGTPLSHLTKMELYRNETLIDTQLEPEMGTAQQFVDETVPEPGSYLYKIVGYVDENAGEITTTESEWIGLDSPMPVTELTLSDVDGTPHLSFKAPAGGANGGYIDRESIIYRIVRNPGNELLTEQLTDTTYIDTDDLALALYSYEVTALLGDTESEPATSNALVFGGALALPYETEMATADETALWTIVDGNNDGKSWVYNDDDDDMEYTAYSAADDWLFTPPFKAGKGSHTLEFRASVFSALFAESMEITLSRDTVPGESQQVITSYPEITSRLAELYSADFDVPEEGDWYLGFHITSPNPFGLYISYCSIKSNVISAINETEQAAGIYYQRESQSLVLKSAGHLDVVDLRGATVISCQVESGTLDVSQLPTGLYIARWSAEGEKSEQIKFIK